MKPLLFLITFFAAGVALFRPQQQPAVKYANVEIDAKTAADWLRKPIRQVESAQINAANAFYVTEGSKIKLYVMDELLKPLNTTEIMEAVEAAQGQTNGKVNEDKLFSLNQRTSYGEMNIDLWGHSRKTVTVNGKQVTLLTADQIYVAPNINNNYFYTILEGIYKASNPMLRKAYLVHVRYNQVPTIFQQRVWTEGESSVIKVGMGTPEYPQIKVGNKTAPIGGYPTIGFVDMAATAKAKPNPDKVYYIKYQLNGMPEKFALPFQIITPLPPNDPNIPINSCPPCPVRTGYDSSENGDGGGEK
ncbi:MAG: hypothetical protein U0X91_21410 [Spirosomataceae bacterium]